MKVALVEANDFASGTSSRSSKLIHGGIRYLEQKEFSLVIEALSERARLFDIAPHLVHPLRFIIPLYKSGRVGMELMNLGMMLYDVLSLWETPEPYSRLDKDELTDALPFINQKDLLGGFSYSDAYMDDDRLVFETLRSAGLFGANSVNYVKVTGADVDSGRIQALHCHDEISNRTYRLRAKHFVGTLGPWTDIFASDIFKDWKSILRPSKGVHLTFQRSRLPLEQAVVMGAEERIVFGIPRHDMIIIGTTDTDFPTNPGEVRADVEDVKYLIEVANRYFPGAQLSDRDIVSVYAGVRPLVDDRSQTESKTSREHIIYRDPRNLTLVAGGKYTTYRLMAEQTVNVVLENWGLEDRAKFARTFTLNPLNEKISPALYLRALNQSPLLAEKFNLPEDVTRPLCERHGLEAEEILNSHLTQVKAKASTVAELFYGLEVFHAIETTMCFSLRDFVFRRTHLFLAEKDHGSSLFDFLSRLMAAALGWSEDERMAQINAVQNQILFELAWRH